MHPTDRSKFKRLYVRFTNGILGGESLMRAKMLAVKASRRDWVVIKRYAKQQNNIRESYSKPKTYRNHTKTKEYQKAKELYEKHQKEETKISNGYNKAENISKLTYEEFEGLP